MPTWFDFLGAFVLTVLSLLFGWLGVAAIRHPEAFVQPHEIVLPTPAARAEARAYYSGTLLPLAVLFLGGALDTRRGLGGAKKAQDAGARDATGKDATSTAAKATRRRKRGASASRRSGGAEPTETDQESSNPGLDGPSSVAVLGFISRRTALALASAVLGTFAFARVVARWQDDEAPNSHADMMHAAEIAGFFACLSCYIAEVARDNGKTTAELLGRIMHDVLHHSPVSPTEVGITFTLALLCYYTSQEAPRVESVTTAAPVFLRSMVIYAAVYGAAFYLFEIRKVFRKDKFSKTYHSQRFISKELQRWLWTTSIGSAWDVLLHWAWTSGAADKPHEGDYIEFAGAAWIIPRVLALVLFADLHFYMVHRLLHIGPLYSYVHYLHHQSRNTNVISGLSFHPVESVIYFSSAAMATLLLPLPGGLHRFEYFGVRAILDFTPVFGHNGVGGLGGGSYMHYLHHTKRHWNFGGTPTFDALFGTLLDHKKLSNQNSTED